MAYIIFVIVLFFALLVYYKFTLTFNQAQAKHVDNGNFPESTFWTLSCPIADSKFCYIGNKYEFKVAKHVFVQFWLAFCDQPWSHG